MAQKVAEYELYRRIKLLGEGAFGKAYLVEFLQDKSIWVIKYMDMTSMSTQEKDETLREAKILEYLKHPNIVKFKEVYKTKKGKLCIVMEFAGGGDIAKRIKDQRGSFFPENQILDWFTQICLALKHVHDRKIIHRDLKGQNIFLTKDNRVKLGDFGIARVLKKTMEKAKTMVGTPYYISPEIIEGKAYSMATDIWSIGVVLYELCALKPPFNAENLHYLALKIVKGQYTPIPSHYSRDMKDLIAKLLQVDPRRRPTIQDILKYPIIVNRIKGFLSETIRSSEFSHTILHNRVFDPKANLNQVKVINKELPCPAELLQQNIRALQDDALPQIAKPVQPAPLKQVQPSPVANSFPAQLGKVDDPGKQQKSQPSQFDPKPIQTPNRPPTAQQQPGGLRPPQLGQQGPVRPPQLQPNDLPKPPLLKAESRDYLQQKAPAQVQQQQRPQSHIVGNVQQVVSPKPVAQKAVGQINQAQKPVSNQAQRPQSSAQQAKPQEKVVEKRVVVKQADVKKQRPQSEYRANDVKKQTPPQGLNQAADARVEARIKQLKEDQRAKEQREIESMKRQQLAEQKKKEDEQRRRDEEQKRREDDIRRREVEQAEQARLDDLRLKREQEAILKREEEASKKRLQMQKENQRQQQNYQAPAQQRQNAPQKKNSYEEEQTKPSNQVSRLPENNQQILEAQQMLAELEAVMQGIQNVQNIMNQLPEQEDKNYFEFQTQMIQKGKFDEEDRDDDTDEPEDIDQRVEDQKREKKEFESKLNKLSKEEEECFKTLRGGSMLDTLKQNLLGQLGKENLEKALALLKKEIDQYDLDEVEEKHGREGYKKLLPFLSDRQRKQCVPLLLTHIITNRSDPY